MIALYLSRNNFVKLTVTEIISKTLNHSNKKKSAPGRHIHFIPTTAFLFRVKEQNEISK